VITINSVIKQHLQLIFYFQATVSYVPSFEQNPIKGLYILFTDDVSTTQVMWDRTTNYMIMNYDFGGMWKKAVVAYLG
jgi:hypothetical protein